MVEKPFRIRLVTPEARVFDSQARYASVPMHDGQMGFMANAAAVVGKLGAGKLTVEFLDRIEVGVKLEEGGQKQWYIAGGFMQNVNNVLTILASSATAIEDLDAAKAKAELDAALAAKPANPADTDRINTERQNARAKVALAGR